MANSIVVAFLVSALASPYLPPTTDKNFPEGVPWVSPFDEADGPIEPVPASTSAPAVGDPCAAIASRTPHDTARALELDQCRYNVSHGVSVTPVQPTPVRAISPRPQIAADEEKAPGLEVKPKKPRAERDSWGLAFTLTGGVLIVGGIVMMIVGMTEPKASRDRDRQTNWPRDACVTGKPCGDACIDPADTCHMDSGGAFSNVARPGLFVGGLLALGAGGTLLSVGARQLYRASESRQTVFFRVNGFSVRF